MNRFICLLLSVSLLSVASISYAQQDSEFKIVHQFATHPNDAVNSSSALIVGTDGNFYGPDGGGAIFRMTTAGAVTILYGATGDSDDSYQFTHPLVQANDGNFYGVARSYYYSANGIVFRMTPAGNFSVLHYFEGGAGGKEPIGPLIQGRDGYLYGATVDGGAIDDKYSSLSHGVIYKLSLAGDFQVIHTFPATGDATQPAASLIQDDDGSLYGSTHDYLSGGGSVYRLSPDGTFTVLHQFVRDSTTNGSNPQAGLLLAGDGNFYGTTSEGGTHDGGIIFRLSPTGNFTLLHSFEGQVYTKGYAQEGAGPNSALIQASNGDLFGTTSRYNALSSSPAVLFRFSLTNGYSVLHVFNKETVGLTFGPDGNLYGGEGGAEDADVYRLSEDYFNPPAPVVTVTATIPECYSYVTSEGEFTLSIPAPAASKFKVSYVVAGSAVNGRDYAYLKGSVKFKVGEQSKTVRVVPAILFDAPSKLAVKLKVQAGNGYLVGASKSAKVKILGY